MKLSKDEQKFVKTLKDQQKMLDRVRELKAQAKTEPEIEHSHGCDQKDGPCVFESPFMGNGFHVNYQAAVEGKGQTEADAYLAIARCIGEANSLAIAKAVEIGRAAGIDDPTLSDMLEATLQAIHNIAEQGRMINRFRKLEDE